MISAKVREHGGVRVEPMQLAALLLENQCRRLFDLAGAVTGSVDDATVAKDLANGLSDAERPIFEELNARNGRWFDLEIEKLERWTGDRRDGLKGSLDDLDARIKEAKKAARFAPQSAREASAPA